MDGQIEVQTSEIRSMSASHRFTQEFKDDLAGEAIDSSKPIMNVAKSYAGGPKRCASGC